MATYFRERRVIGTTLCELEPGRLEIRCEIHERWEDIDSTTARCGDDGTCTISRHIGVSQKTAETIKASIETELGLSGISKLKTSIEGTIGREVIWEARTETTKTFPFKVPKCGRATLTIYQLFRDYDISIWRRKRWPGGGEWRETGRRLISEALNAHDALKDIEDRDPGCKCPPAPADDPHGFLCLDFGTVSLRLPYRLTDTELELLGLESAVAFSIEKFDSRDNAMQSLLEGIDFKIARRLLPEPILFLLGDAGSGDADVNTRFIALPGPERFEIAEAAVAVSGGSDLVQ